MWTGAVVAFVFTSIPSWTTWVLLVAMALYDLFAVLTPHGPLQLLVNMAIERDEDIPALVYEAREVRRPRRRAAAPDSQHAAQATAAAGAVPPAADQATVAGAEVGSRVTAPGPVAEARELGGEPQGVAWVAVGDHRAVQSAVVSSNGVTVAATPPPSVRRGNTCICCLRGACTAEETLGSRPVVAALASCSLCFARFPCQSMQIRSSAVPYQFQSQHSVKDGKQFVGWCRIQGGHYSTGQLKQATWMRH
jgi:Presenilin